MESSETPEQHMGGIYNYFQGATIHNIVINGNMNKNASESYSRTEDKKGITPEQVIKALRNTPEFFSTHASYSIAFCVCRDLYNMGDNATQFERMLIEKGISIPLGTINNALSRKPFLRYNIYKWDEKNVTASVLKARDSFIEQIENHMIKEETNS